MNDRDTAHPATMNATKSQARNLQLDPCNFFMRWTNSNLWKDMVLTFGHLSPVMISLKLHQKPSINSRCSLQRSPAKPSATVKLQLLLDSTTSIVVWKSLVQQDILAGKNMDEMMKLIMPWDFMWIKWRCEGYASFETCWPSSPAKESKEFRWSKLACLLLPPVPSFEAKADAAVNQASLTIFFCTAALVAWISKPLAGQDRDSQQAEWCAQISQGQKPLNRLCDTVCCRYLGRSQESSPIKLWILVDLELKTWIHGIWSYCSLRLGLLNYFGFCVQELQEKATKELTQLLARAEAWGKVGGAGQRPGGRPGGRSGSLEVCKMTLLQF